MGSRGRSDNVLVTAAGTIVAQGIMKCLRLANIEKPASAYRIIASDMSPQAVGLYRADLGLLVPPATAEDYVDAIVKVCGQERISAVFVGSEEELPVLEKREVGSRRRREARSSSILQPCRLGRTSSRRSSS